MSKFQLKEERFNQILDNMAKVKIGLIGDACLDVYWEADMTKSELSRETPHYPLPIVKESFSLGGCANVAANMAALGINELSFVSPYGKDWRGRIMLDLFELEGINPRNLCVVDNFITPTYCKPIRCGISDVKYEDPRIDFANYSPIPLDKSNELLDKVREIGENSDIIAVTDQFSFGCLNEPIRNLLSEIGKSKPVIVDSRDNAFLYKNVIIKPNEVETKALTGIDLLTGDLEKKALSIYEKLNPQTNMPIIITLGAKGSLWIDKTRASHVPAFPVMGDIDFVGAGDTFLAALAASYATGATPTETLYIANLAASITIKKLGKTGTVTQEELRSKYKTC